MDRRPILVWEDYLIGTQRRDFYKVDIREPIMSTKNG